MRLVCDLSPSSLPHRPRRSAIVTATVAPTLSTLTDGDTIAAVLSAGALDPGNYASTGGTIVSAVGSYTADGAPVAVEAPLGPGTVVTGSVTATDSAGNGRTFGLGVQTVAFIAPAAAGGIGDRIWTAGDAIAPVDLAADFSGSAPIGYTLAPASAALPSGVTLSDEGMISGSPEAASSTRNIVVRGTNGGGFADTAFAITVEGAAGTGVITTITEMPFSGYVYDAALTETAVVTIQGTGTAGASVEVRGASAGGNTAWASGTVDGLGDFAVQLSVPLAQWGNWYAPEARILNNDATKLTGTNLFGCGHAIGIMGQSELEKLVSRAGTNVQLSPAPALLAENLSIMHDSTGSDGGAANFDFRRVTSGTGENPGAVGLANMLHTLFPGRKIMLVDMATEGTGRSNLMGAASLTERWPLFQAMMTEARAGGSEIGLIIENWMNSDGASVKTLPEKWAPWYMGQHWNGDPFTLGDTNTRGAGDVRIDNCLWDVEAATGEKGRAVFSRDRTKMVWMGWMPRLTTGTGEAANFSNGNASADGWTTQNQHDAPSRARLIELAEDSRAQTLVAAYGPSAHVVKMGDLDEVGGEGNTHLAGFVADGQVLMGQHMGVALAMALGSSLAEPQITGAETAADGSFADIIVSLPNGGTLTTLRALRSEPDPDPPMAHQQPVVGFEIGRAAVGDASRRPVFSDVAYPDSARGTVAIVDSGSGSPRTGRVRITPVVPFAENDRVDYLRGGATALIQASDRLAFPYRSMLIEHVPALENGADTYPYPGIAVRAQPPQITLVPSVPPVVQFTLALDGDNLALGTGTLTLTGDNLETT